MAPTGTIEIDINYSTLISLLDDVAEYANGLPNKKLKKFIRNAFHITNDTAEGASNLTHFIFKPDARYLDLLPALRAGDITFDSLCNILATKIGVGNESCHT
jgi:hypothetical protein